MIQPSVYSREQIIEAAFELIREKGWSALSTRAIAKKLGSSTMPIYSHVKSVEELEKDLQHKARAMQKSFQQQLYTEHALLNLAFGYVVFARDEKSLFRFLYLDRPNKINLENGESMKEAFLLEFDEGSEERKALMELKASGQEALIQYTWIFTHGLAMLVNAGTFGSNSNQSIMSFLMNAGEAFYLWGIREKGEVENDQTD
mgnify:CR=1 FL=1